MTDDRMALKALVEKGSDAELLAEMLGFVANRLMALDAEVLCNAKAYERSAERANHRNGYRDRAWQTRAGRVDLKVPKLRKGCYFPEFLEPRRTAEKALVCCQRLMNRLLGVHRGGFWLIVTLESEDETQIRTTRHSLRQTCQRHPPGDAQALFG